MSETRTGWSKRKKAAVATGIALITAFAVVCNSGRRWAHPVPGVRVEMSRPFVGPNDLGPESAYRLLDKALAEPPDARRPGSVPAIWENDWQDAVAKFAIHGWPTELPPPAPRTGHPDTPIPVQAGDAPGGAMGGRMFCSSPALAPGAPWTREQCDDIRRLLKLYEPRIALLDRALAAPAPQMPLVDCGQINYPDFVPARTLGNWLAVSAHWRAAAGDYAGCVRDVDRALGLGNLASRGNSLHPCHTADECMAVTARGAWRIALHNELPAADLSGMAKAFLACAEAAEPLPEILRSHAAMNIAEARKVYRLGSLEGLDYEPMTAVRRWWLRLAYLRGSTPAGTQRSIEAYYANLIALAEKPYGTTTQTELDAFADAFGQAVGSPRLLGLRDPVGAEIICLVGVHGGDLLRERATHLAGLHGMALFCAVQAYRKEQGEPPDTLDQLVPGCLPRIPSDPFDGKPFRYRKHSVPGLPPQAWAVYSIGPDFIDNGGEARSEGRATEPMVDNPDIVWPSCPYSPLPEPELGPLPCP